MTGQPPAAHRQKGQQPPFAATFVAAAPAVPNNPISSAAKLKSLVFIANPFQM